MKVVEEVDVWCAVVMETVVDVEDGTNVVDEVSVDVDVVEVVGGGGGGRVLVGNVVKVYTYTYPVLPPNTISLSEEYR